MGTQSTADQWPPPPPWHGRLGTSPCAGWQRTPHPGHLRGFCCTIGPPGIQGGGGAVRSQPGPQWAERRGRLPNSNSPHPDPGSRLCCHPHPLNELSERLSRLPRAHVALLTLHAPAQQGSARGCGRPSEQAESPVSEQGVLSTPCVQSELRAWLSASRSTPRPERSGSTCTLTR